MESTLNLEINRQTIVDQVASFLHSSRIVDDEMGEITDIKFGDTNSRLVPIVVSIKGKEVLN